MTRWAVLSASGRNLRVYARSIECAAAVLDAQGDRLLYAMDAGAWERGRLKRAGWDVTTLQEGRLAPGK